MCLTENDFGGIFTRNRTHWDSQKEYEEFWHPERKKYNFERKPKKTRKKRWFLFWVFLVCLILACWFGRDFFKSRIEKRLSKSSESFVESDPKKIPDFNGQDYVVLNNNIPLFSGDDIQDVEGEIYSDLDSLGRCGTAIAMLSKEMMPTEERGSIGQVKPTGWKQEKYEGYVDSNPPYLYNRCHLIAYALTGQNANERNLITGTRYMNATTMLEFEKQVMQYLDHSENHVLYRVTPYFKGNELVARGVEMEAYSIEDNGAGVCFHVFVYNYQPGIEINYLTGESCIK